MFLKLFSEGWAFGDFFLSDGEAGADFKSGDCSSERSGEDWLDSVKSEAGISPACKSEEG